MEGGPVPIGTMAGMNNVPFRQRKNAVCRKAEHESAPANTACRNRVQQNVDSSSSVSFLRQVV